MSSSTVQVAACMVAQDLVVEVSGELDMASVRAASAALQPHLTSGPYERVLLHARGVTFCDSSGLQFILRLAARMRARGGVELLSCSPQLQRVIDVAAVGEVLPPNVGALAAG